MLKRDCIKLSSEHDIYLNNQRQLNHNKKNIYFDGIENQFKLLIKYLPNKCNKLLSIGCGLAVPELMFKEYYNNDIDYYLFDKTQVDLNIYFGYKEKASYYNNLNLTNKIYLEYGINNNNINIIDADNKNLLSLPLMDIIVSYIAWGFHFPLITYLDNVLKLMHKETILIIDIRNNTNVSEKLIDKYFYVLNNNDLVHHDFSKNPKSFRYILKKK